MRKIITQILVFTLIFSVIFAIARGFMHSAFIPSDLADEYKSDIIQMFIRGLRMDLKVILIGFAPLLLLGYIALLWRFAQSKSNSQILERIAQIARRIYPTFSSIYIGIMAILSALFSFIGFYYYDMFKSKIDIFIFGLKDDDTSAIFSIIFKDYPIALIVACVAIFSAFCVWLNNKILVSPPPQKQRESSTFIISHHKTRIALLIFGNIILLYAYVVAVRGHFVYNTLRPSDYRFSTLSVINEIATNPILAFSWAHKLYKSEQTIQPANIDELNALQNELFPLWQPLDSHINSANPHIMLNIMESFGLNLLAFEDESHNFLGALKEHFENDFLFIRFLSSTNNTSRSLSNILSLAQNASIYQGKYRSLKLPLTPIEFYKNLGYKVIAIYSGNSAWYNIGDFLVAQGVDEFVDETTLMAHYPQSKQTKHKYGIADEFAYKYIFEVLQNATKPTLIINITISHHKPYYHAKDKDLSHLFSDIPQGFSINANVNALEYLKTYAYANNEFGKFLTKIKRSKLKDSTIIAATGDHRARELPIDESSQRAFAYSVPFYVFVPQKYHANLHYDKNRIGSHKDIFPTLYALSGSKDSHYFSVGGRDMFAKPKDKRLEFGINESVFIDESGIYPLGSKQGFSYKSTDSLLNESAGFEADNKHAEFINKYNKLNDLQLRARVNGQNIILYDKK